MKARGTLKSAVEGFLGTFVSRNTDFHGYWLFGFLVAGLERRSIDLLADETPRDESNAWRAAAVMARSRFRDQAGKHRMPLDRLSRAEVVLRKLAEQKESLVSGAERRGHTLEVMVLVETDDGRAYERARRLFVEPHSGDREHRSTRWDPKRPHFYGA